MNKQHRPNPTIKDYLYGKQAERMSFFTELASLAPSPYNTQPWQFEVTNNRIYIRPNFERRLLEADPALRGLYFSLGAAAENIALASHSLSVKEQVSVRNEGENFCVSISLEIPNDYPHNIDFSTIDAIKQRHTNRFAFSKDPLPIPLLQFIESQNTDQIASVITSDSLKVDQLQRLTQDAVKQIFSKKKFTRELANWLKSSRAKHEGGMPGYVLGIPTWFSYVLPRLIRYGSAKVVTKAQQKVHARWFDSAQTLGYVGAKQETPELIFGAGRIFERIGVEAQKYGVALGPMSALIEAQGFENEVRNIFQTETRPIMLYRIGFATQIPPHSPRYKVTNINS